MKGIFIKQHSREYSLFRVCSLHENYTKLVPNLFGFEVKEVCQIYRGALVSIYYTKEAWEGLLQAIAKKSVNPEFVRKQFKILEEDFNYLLPYFRGEKRIESVDEFKKVFERYNKYYFRHGLAFAIPRVESLPKESIEIAMNAREKIADYNEAVEEVFKETLERFYPYLKDKTQFILPEEVWSGGVEDKEKTMGKIKERERGFVFYQGKLYTGDIDEILNKLGIVLEDFKSKSKQLSGQVASPGKVKGIAKIVSSVKDLDKIKDGDVLVAAMTMPKYLPAMKKASAFVTDEGGITCHAAIVSREMKKPCIIGTKIATQILRDGDFIEVDANKGVVKILEKSN